MVYHSEMNAIGEPAVPQSPAAVAPPGGGAVPPSLPERIAHRLRRDILRGDLPPGATIKERERAAALGVSRTPLREAIRILAREGLVVLRPARSPLVADPSLKEVTDAIAVLIALEVLSGRLACRVAPEVDLARITAVQAQMAADHGRVDALDLFETDMAFHRAIAAASGNEALAETHAAYLARLWRARYLSARQAQSRERVLRQHGEIVAALVARDPERAADAIEAHLRHLADNVAAVFRGRDEQGTARAKERDET